MRHWVLGLALATLLLGGAGFTTESTYVAGSAPVTRYALIAALESHDGGAGIALEHHSCADGCASMSAIALLPAARTSPLGSPARSSSLPQAARVHALAFPPILFHPPR